MADMAERDITGEVFESASRLLERLDEHLKVAVFAGPLRQRLSRRQALRRLQQMAPEERLQLMATAGGPDPLLDAVEGLLNG